MDYQLQGQAEGLPEVSAGVEGRQPDPSKSSSTSPPGTASLTSLQSSRTSHASHKLSSPIYLDHLELKSCFRTKNVKYWDEPLPGHLQYFFNLPLAKHGIHSGSLGGDYHASTSGRRIVNGFHSRPTERQRGRNAEVSLHNLLTKSERAELAALAQNIPHWEWQIRTFLTAFATARSWVFSRLEPNHQFLNPGERKCRFADRFFPITCPEIEFYREYPVPSDEFQFFNCLERAISSSFGDIYDTERREKYSRRWLIKAFNGQRKKAIWIKCYRKGPYFRLEVQIRNPIVDRVGDAITEDLSLLTERLISIGMFASDILNEIDAKLGYNFSDIDVAKLDAVIRKLFSRSTDSKRMALFVKCIAETYAYTPTDHRKEDRISREHHLKKLVEARILTQHKQVKFVASNLKLRPVKKYFYILSEEWETVADKMLNPTF